MLSSAPMPREDVSLALAPASRGGDTVTALLAQSSLDVSKPAATPPAQRTHGPVMIRGSSLSPELTWRPSPRRAATPTSHAWTPPAYAPPASHMSPGGTCRAATPSRVLQSKPPSRFRAQHLKRPASMAPVAAAVTAVASSPSARPRPTKSPTGQPRAAPVGGGSGLCAAGRPLSTEVMRRAEIGLSLAPKARPIGAQGCRWPDAAGRRTATNYAVRWQAGIDSAARQLPAARQEEVESLRGSGLNIERFIYAESGLQPSAFAKVIADDAPPEPYCINPHRLPIHYGGASAAASLTGLSQYPAAALAEVERARHLGGRAQSASWVRDTVEMGQTHYRSWGGARAKTLTRSSSARAKTLTSSAARSQSRPASREASGPTPLAPTPPAERPTTSPASLSYGSLPPPQMHSERHHGLHDACHDGLTVVSERMPMPARLMTRAASLPACRQATGLSPSCSARTLATVHDVTVSSAGGAPDKGWV